MHITVKVHKGPEKVLETDDGLDVFTPEPMERNRANRDVIKQIASHYRVPTTNVKIIRGSTTRKKIVEVTP